MPSQMENDDIQARFHSFEMGQQLMTENIARLSRAIEGMKINKADETMVSRGDESVEARSSAPSTRETKARKIKPSQPGDFDGSRAKGRAFINSCMIYISLCPAEFTTEQDKVKWVLSFMKKDRAATFSDHTLRIETRTGLPRFDTFDALYAAFITLFCPANEESTAMMRLETEEYHQNKREVDEYIDEFEDLVALSGYTDPRTITMKFRRGLNPIIQVKIAELARDRPKDDDPTEWYAMARLYDQSRISSLAFLSSPRKAPVTSASASSGRSVFPRVPAPPPSHVTPSISQNRTTTGMRSGVDAQFTRSTPRACFRCGSLEHLALNCDKRIDVRAMSLELRDDLLEQLMAAKDTATEAMEEVSREDDSEGQADFVQRSG
jgi:hypothetical protein